MKYWEIKKEEPKLHNCFFAFNNQQFNEGIAKFHLEKELEEHKIVKADGGLYGTREGIQELYSFYDEQSKRIAENCSPQEVYENEFQNHECGYTGNDEEAIKIVVAYFGEERTKTVKRHNGTAFIKIENLDFSY